MKWFLLLPLLLAACAPASDVRELREQVAVIREQQAVLREQVAVLRAKDAAQETRFCKALYLAWAAMVKVGAAEDRSLNNPLPGCPTWRELNQ